MNVRLISVTKPCVEGLESAEDLIIHNARVSNPSNQLNIDTGGKLIAYCIKNKHWSIFDQAMMGVEIKTSRAISAQILRHKSFFFQEYSARYSCVEGYEGVELRLQGKTNRQVGDATLQDNNFYFQDKISEAIDRSFEIYTEMVDYGVAKECARMILPMCSSTTVCMTGTVRSWIHYFEVRCDRHTQKEHRDIALAIRDIFSKEFPIISEQLFSSASS